MKPLPLLFGLILLAQACRDNNSSNDYPLPPWACQDEPKLGPVAARDKLIGSWEWKQVDFVFEKSNNTQNQGLIAVFNPDSTVYFLRNGQLPPSATWWVTGSDSTNLEMHSNPSVDIISGRIGFCLDAVKFDQSSIDLPVNFYRRLK